METARSKRRSRRGKPKKSSMRVRLNPEFDVEKFTWHKPRDINLKNHKILEELDPRSLEFNALAEKLNSSFIYEYLQKILHFLKSNQKEMCFPNLALHKKVFLVKIAEEKSHLMSRAFNEASASIGRQILDVLENNKESYRWVHSYEDGKVVKNVLFYKKLVVNSSQDEMMPNSQSPSPIIDKQMTKADREYELKMQLAENLSEEFINDALNRTLEFIEDKYRASMEFNNVDALETRFLQWITAISRSEEQYKLYSPQNVVLMKSIARSYRREPWKLKVDVCKINKATGCRTVIFGKTPTFQDVPIDDQNIESFRTEPSPKITRKLQEKSIHEIQQKKSISNISMERIKQTNRLNENNNSTANKLMERLRSNSKEVKSRLSNIEFESAGAQVTESSRPISAQTACDVNRYESSRPISAQILCDVSSYGRRGIRNRKDKLIEAMSTPLESDIAEKMMRRMGWSGGALGARGEGIVEPLMPALHLTHGAGLGHAPGSNLGQIKQPKQTSSTNQSVAEFRLAFLTNLLTFLQSQSTDTLVSFSQTIKKREERFLTLAFRCFNDRKTIGLGRPGEVVLVNKIEEILFGDLGLTISYKVKDDKRQIHLTKICGELLTIPVSRRKRKRSKANLDIFASITENDTLIDQLEINSNRELFKCHKNSKAANTLAYRMLFLETIKDFLEAESEMGEFKFDRILNVRQRKFVQNVVNDFNQRTMKNKRHKKAGTKDIYNYMNCYLSVEFSGQKFILQKYNENEQPNPTLGLPASKSTDSENTFTYDDLAISIDDENDDSVAISDTELSNAIKNIISHTSDEESEKGENDNDQENGKYRESDMSQENDKLQENYTSRGNKNCHESEKGENYNDQENGNYRESDMSQENDTSRENENCHGSATITESDKYQENEKNQECNRNQANVKIQEYNKNDTNQEIFKNQEIDQVQENRHAENEENDEIDEDELMDTDLESSRNDISLDISTESGAKEMIGEENDSVAKVNDLNPTVQENIQTDKICDNCNLQEEEKLMDFADSDLNTKDKDKMDFDDNGLNSTKGNEKIMDFDDNGHDSTKGKEKTIDIDGNDLNFTKGKEKIMDFDDNDVNSTKDKEKITDYDDNGLYSTKDKEKKMDFDDNGLNSTKDTSNQSLTDEKSNSKIVYVSIQPEDCSRISLDLIKSIQTLISNSYDNCAFLPLLKCHGVQNGALIYSCHCGKTYDWLKISLGVASVKISTTFYRKELKLLMKINSFIPVDVKTILERLQNYYPSLKTKDWVISNGKTQVNYATFVVHLDKSSYDFILQNKFSLFCGIDKIDFAYVWDTE